MAVANNFSFVPTLCTATEEARAEKMVAGIIVYPYLISNFFTVPGSRIILASIAGVVNSVEQSVEQAEPSFFQFDFDDEQILSGKVAINEISEDNSVISVTEQTGRSGFEWLKFAQGGIPLTAASSCLYTYAPGPWSLHLSPYVAPYFTQFDSDTITYFVWPGNNNIGSSPDSIVISYPALPSATEITFININDTSEPIGVRVDQFSTQVTIPLTENSLPSSPALMLMQSVGYIKTWAVSFNYDDSSNSKCVMFLTPYQTWDNNSMATVPAYTDFWYPGTSKFNGRQPQIWVAYKYFFAMPLGWFVSIRPYNNDTVTLANKTNFEIANLAGMVEIPVTAPWPTGPTKLRLSYSFIQGAGNSTASVYCMTLIN